MLCNVINLFLCCINFVYILKCMISILYLNISNLLHINIKYINKSYQNMNELQITFFLSDHLFVKLVGHFYLTHNPWLQTKKKKCILNYSQTMLILLTITIK